MASEEEDPDVAQAIAEASSAMASGSAGGNGEMLPDPSDVQAALGSVATGLAQQLSSITEEMNKIRAELYGDGGIGGIAKELDKLKAGGLDNLGGLLDGAGAAGAGGGADLGDLKRRLGSGAGASASSSSGASAGSAAAVAGAGAAAAGRHGGGGAGGAGQPVAGARPGGAGAHGGGRGGGGGGASGEARRRRAPEDRERDLEELRKMLTSKKQEESLGPSAKQKPSGWDRLVLLFVVTVCFYAASPFFRSTVQQAFSVLVYGKLPEEMEAGEPGDFDDGEILPDY